MDFDIHPMSIPAFLEFSQWSKEVDEDTSEGMAKLMSRTIRECTPIFRDAEPLDELTPLQLMDLSKECRLINGMRAEDSEEETAKN